MQIFPIMPIPVVVHKVWLYVIYSGNRTVIGRALKKMREEI
jgi:hypothetical protein